MSPRDGDPLGLRPEPSATGPKTGKAPAPTVGAAAGSGNIDGPSRFGTAAVRTTDRIVSTDDRREERKAAQKKASSSSSKKASKKS